MSRNAPRREYFEKAKRDLDTSVYFDVNGLWTDTQGLSFNSSLYYITREGGYETQDIRLGKYLGRRDMPVLQCPLSREEGRCLLSGGVRTDCGENMDC